MAVLARAAEGSLRDGLSLLEQAIAYCGDEITDAQVRELLGVVAESVLDDLVEAIAAQSAERALGLVHRLIADGQNLQHFCREAIRHFRNLLVARVCGADSDLVAAPHDERPRLAEQAAQFSEEDLTRFFQILLATDDGPAAQARSAAASRTGPAEAGQRAATGAARRSSRRTPRGDSRRRRQRGYPWRSSATANASASSLPSRAMPSASAAATRSSSARRRAWRRREFVAPVERCSDTNVAGYKRKIRGGSDEPRDRSCRSQQAFAVSAPCAASPPRIVARAAEDADERPCVRASGRDQGGAARIRNFCGPWSNTPRAGKLRAASCVFFSPPKAASLAEMLQARDPMERLRTVLNQVVGQPLRVCVKLDSRSRTSAVGRSSELRARFEEDPIVRAMLEKFGGQISNVKRPGEE